MKNELSTEDFFAIYFRSEIEHGLDLRFIEKIYEVIQVSDSLKQIKRNLSINSLSREKYIISNIILISVLIKLSDMIHPFKFALMENETEIDRAVAWNEFLSTAVQPVERNKYCKSRYSKMWDAFTSHHDELKANPSVFIGLMLVRLLEEAGISFAKKPQNATLEEVGISVVADKQEVIKYLKNKYAAKERVQYIFNEYANDYTFRILDSSLSEIGVMAQNLNIKLQTPFLKNKASSEVDKFIASLILRIANNRLKIMSKEEIHAKCKELDIEADGIDIYEIFDETHSILTALLFEARGCITYDEYIRESGFMELVAFITEAGNYILKNRL